MDKVQDVTWINRLLTREKEIVRARQAGRSTDDCKVMQKVGNVYGSMLNELLDSFPVQTRTCLGFHSFAPQALQAQAHRAEALRRQCDGLDDDTQELDAAQVLARAPAPTIKLVDIDDVLAGPRHVAQKLCHAANLNQDQMRAVALVVKPTEDAWKNDRGAAEVTSHAGDEPTKNAFGGRPCAHFNCRRWWMR